jgi:formylglycine-generating enzyme required for sulfatase activity/tRNA A-37 threonylcarbamoyl transferase component Bud32/dienelactone hydrolase
MIGKTISHYHVVDKIGKGGMGEVFLADDVSLSRRVALKFLPPEMQKDDIAHKRFLREARSAAALNHPYICSIHEVSEVGGKDFIVMEYVEGQTLKERLAKGPFTRREALQVAAEIAEALEQAHDKGIIHRDLKPANIMLAQRGHVKVMDFGLAKQVKEAEKAVGQEDTLTALTREGSTLGTLAYMSPEQLRGEAVDARSDIFSFGIVLYEILTGIHPFRQASPMDTAAGILNKEPAPLSRHLEKVPELLQQTVSRMLAKERGGRHSDIHEVRADLGLLIKQFDQSASGIDSGNVKGIWRLHAKPALIIPGLVVIAVLGYMASTAIYQNREVRWAHQVAVPEIERLVEQEKFVAAFRLTNQAKRYIPTDPVWTRLDPIVSRVVSVDTTPPGAAVSYREYASNDPVWTPLGESPLAKVRVPSAFLAWKVEKQGFVTAENVASAGALMFTLHQPGDVPPGMVYVEAGNAPYQMYIPGLDHLPAEKLHDYWIDRYEVTNREYKRFVDGGGYRNSTFWRQPFVKDGRTLTFEQAIASFTDATGRPGPATWELGNFPEGQDDFPVTGISWYEAAAYAACAGKSLPTIYHWSRVAEQRFSGFMVPRSNFVGRGLMKVGASGAMNRFGAFDMAGNVKEWCWNRADAYKRYILGGAWDEPVYMFNDPDARSPFERAANFGFRCVKYAPEETLASAGAELVAFEARNFNRETPVRDEVFEVYRRLYGYDKIDLKPTTESADESNPDWRREKVSFVAAYGNERAPAFLFLPKNAKPPYQAVVYFPGSGTIQQRSSSQINPRSFDWIIKSGRAVIYPIYKSTFERGDEINSDYPSRTNSFRDHVIIWSKEVSRAIDYLEARQDIARDRIAYMGFSWGAAMGPIYVAVEPRFKACLLVLGGFYMQHSPPEVDAFNFAPRVKVPVLLLNGRFDFFFPIDSSQLPMFRLFGVPDAHKRRVMYDTGHNIPRPDLIRETLDWLDRYLGPVR